MVKLFTKKLLGKMFMEKTNQKVQRAVVTGLVRHVNQFSYVRQNNCNLLQMQNIIYCFMASFFDVLR